MSSNKTFVSSISILIILTAACSSQSNNSFLIVELVAAANGFRTVTVPVNSSPVSAWFANQYGEESLDLTDADVINSVSMVEQPVSFWFLQDAESGDVSVNISESTEGEITDTIGTRYVAEAQVIPAVPDRMTVKLAEAEYIVLSASNSQQRYSSSAVYCPEDWQSKQADLFVRHSRFFVYNYFYSISAAEV